MAAAVVPKRGEIWLVDFDPSVGAEIRKLRPAVVMSVDSIGRLPLHIVVPITDWNLAFSNYPWFVEIPADAITGLLKHSGADAFQVKSVSDARFARQLGNVSRQQADAIAEAIALCVGCP